VLAGALDRLGRSLVDLLDTLNELEAAGAALVIHQQAIDTTTPAGRMFFQVTGAFAEFERAMIRSRVKAGLERAKARGVRLVARGPVPRSRPPSAQVWQPETVSRRSRRRWASAMEPCRGSKPQ
jgi:DNA invertase Pin-like site-specific DNA recombinase